MQKETIKLIEDVANLTGLTELTIGCYFGNVHAAERVRNGGATLNTCLAFAKYLKDAKAYAKRHGKKELKHWLLVNAKHRKGMKE